MNYLKKEKTIHVICFFTLQAIFCGNKNVFWEIQGASYKDLIAVHQHRLCYLNVACKYISNYDQTRYRIGVIPCLGRLHIQIQRKTLMVLMYKVTETYLVVCLLIIYESLDEDSMNSILL